MYSYSLIPSIPTEDTETPAQDNNGEGDDDDDEGNLLIDEGGAAGEEVVSAGGGGALACPPELLDIAVALNEDRVSSHLGITSNKMNSFASNLLTIF